MIRLLLLSLPVSLLGWWALGRLGLPRPRAWAGGVAISFTVLGAIVLLGDSDRAEGRAVAALIWLGVHALLYGLLRPFLGRGPWR